MRALAECLLRVEMETLADRIVSEANLQQALCIVEIRSRNDLALIIRILEAAFKTTASGRMKQIIVAGQTRLDQLPLLIQVELFAWNKRTLKSL